MTSDPAPKPSTAAERLAAALGIPVPPPMTDEQIRDFEAKQDAADAEAERIYGPPLGVAEALRLGDEDRRRLCVLTIVGHRTPEQVVSDLIDVEWYRVEHERRQALRRMRPADA